MRRNLTRAKLSPMGELEGIRGLLVDLDGTLYVGNEALPGTRDALKRLRGVPIRFVTNTTSKPRRAIAERLDAMGFAIDPGHILTAPRVAAAALMDRGVKRAHFLLRDEVIADMHGIEPVDEGADAVVVGDLGDQFSYERLNAAFRLLLDGATLYALAENRMFRGGDGMCLDVGAFVRALEYGAQCEAVLLGKPAKAFFETAIAVLGLPPAEVASVGDDLEGDVGGGMNAGLTGVLVRTGKFREQELQKLAVRPDLVIDSFADLPALLGC